MSDKLAWLNEDEEPRVTMVTPERALLQQIVDVLEPMEFTERNRLIRTLVAWFEVEI